jgi:DNA-binding CsgD family transcriptional regulator/PAS domain-containing protein
MYSDAVTLELVDLIYDAAGDAGRWGCLLERLGQVLNGSAGSLHSQHRNSQQADVAASWNINSDLITEYVSHYSRVNPCFGVGTNLIREGAVNPRQALCSDQLLLASEFYNDYLQRLDAFHGVAATILEDGTTSANLTIFRPKRSNPIDQAECDLLSVLMPHFQRAFQLHNRIQGLEQKGAAAADALEQLPVGLVMLSADGKVLQVNGAASAILAGQRALRVTSRGLVAEIPSENQRLQRLIRGAITTGTGKGLDSGGAILIAPGGLKRSLQVLVVPLRTRAVRICNDVPVAAVFITDPDREPVSEAQVFAQLFRLTPAEARLARILAAGDSLREASEQLNIAESTVKSQLKSIFAKTNTSRQSELVRLLLMTPARSLQARMVSGDVLR